MLPTPDSELCLWVHGARARESLVNHQESRYGRLLMICSFSVDEASRVKSEFRSEQLYDPLAEVTYVARHELA